MCVCVCVVFQQAAYHPEVNKEVQRRALRYGSECSSGYLALLEHVLVVRGEALTAQQMCPRVLPETLQTSIAAG